MALFIWIAWFYKFNEQRQPTYTVFKEDLDSSHPFKEHFHVALPFLGVSGVFYSDVSHLKKVDVSEINNVYLSNNFEHYKNLSEQKNAKLIEVIKLNNSKNFYNFIKSKPKTPTKNDIQK